jgi:hypothetical protein
VAAGPSEHESHSESGSSSIDMKHLPESVISRADSLTQDGFEEPEARGNRGLGARRHPTSGATRTTAVATVLPGHGAERGSTGSIGDDLHAASRRPAHLEPAAIHEGVRSEDATVDGWRVAGRKGGRGAVRHGVRRRSGDQ